jgi:hypothetical protein
VANTAQYRRPGVSPSDLDPRTCDALRGYLNAVDEAVAAITPADVEADLTDVLGRAGNHEMPRRRFPCDECPIRADNVDNPKSKFPPERWEALGVTVRDPLTGREPGLNAPLFGCHKQEPGTGADLACAGWLAQFGHDHIAVRLAVAQLRLPADALRPGENWPPLHQTWEHVVRSQSISERNANE